MSKKPKKAPISASPAVEDVIVIGGGPAGCTLTALLSAHGLNAVCIDQDDPVKTLEGGFDGRTMAISFGSRQVIEAAGVWTDFQDNACPIRDIQILDSGSPVLLDFLAEDVESEAFGWIIENRLLRQCLYKRLAALEKVQGKKIHRAPAKVTGFSAQKDYITVHLETGEDLNARLVVGADGRASFTREWMGIGTRGWSYNQRAIVCVVTHENPHDNKAIEHFRPEGPFAVLPMMDDKDGKHRSSLVWTEHGPAKTSALHWDEETFNAALNARFLDYYGTVRLAGKRFSYPLSLSHAHSYIGHRMALVADAGHGIHPIAGQGLNIGLRDIAALAELLVEAKEKGEDCGSQNLLETYQRRRRFDNMTMAAATDLLNKLFSNSIPPVRLVRQIGLRLVQNIAPARKFFMRQAMGAAGSLPTLIRTGKF